MRRPTVLLAAVLASVAVAAVALLAGWIAPLATPPAAVPAPADSVRSADRAASDPELHRALAEDARVLVGRCVDWHTGEPIPHAGVSVLPGGSTRADRAGNWRIERFDDAWARRVRAHATGYVPVERTVAYPQRTALTVAMRRSGQVQGQLLDRDGRPFVSAVVHLEWTADVGREDGWEERFARSATVGGDGRFSFADPVPRGRVRVSVDGATPLFGTHDYVIEERTFLDLCCRPTWRGEAITGVVLDARGRPVPEALVHARDEGVLVAAARSDHRGRFRLLGGRDGASCSLTATVTNEGRVRQRRVDGVAWGSVDVPLQLEVGAGIVLQVTEARTRRPIERYAVQCVRVSGVRSGSAGSLAPPSRHEGGWSRLVDLADGSYRLVVWPEDARWLPNLPVRFEVREGQPTSVAVSLEPARSCRVVLLDDTGSPVEGARVQLLRRGEHDVVRDLQDVLRSGGSRSQLTVRLATATTDARGIAALRWFHDPDPALLRIEGAGFEPFEVDGVRWSQGAQVVRVRRAGLVDLVLPGAAGWSVVATRDDGRQVPPSWSAPCRLDEDANARLALPAGTWSVRVVAPAGERRPSVSVAAQLAVRPGQRIPIERDLRAAMAPTNWSVRVLFDGEPVRVAELVSGEPGQDGAFDEVDAQRVTLDDDGRFVAPALPPGTYRLFVPWSCAGQEVRVPVTGWTELSAGARREGPVVSIATGVLDLQLETAAGDPVRDGVAVLRGGNGCALVVTPDPDGRVRAERVPVGAYRVTWRGPTGRIPAGTVLIGEPARQVVPHR